MEGISERTAGSRQDFQRSEEAVLPNGEGYLHATLHGIVPSITELFRFVCLVFARQHIF